MSSQGIGAMMIALAAFAIAALLIREAGKKVAKERSSTPADVASPDEGIERLVRVLRGLDKNQAQRFTDLKLFLFFLPLIWGVIAGVLYLIILAIR